MVHTPSLQELNGAVLPRSLRGEGRPVTLQALLERRRSGLDGPPGPALACTCGEVGHEAGVAAAVAADHFADLLHETGTGLDDVERLALHAGHTRHVRAGVAELDHLEAAGMRVAVDLAVAAHHRDGPGVLAGERRHDEGGGDAV